MFVFFFFFFIQYPSSLKGRGQGILIKSVCLSVCSCNSEIIHNILAIFPQEAGYIRSSVFLKGRLHLDWDPVSNIFYGFFSTTSGHA